MSRVAEPVVDPLTPHASEERQVVRGDVDGTAPCPLDPRLRQTGQQTAQAVFGARGGWEIAAEPPIDPAAQPDRARAAPHQDAPVVRRPEVVQEHAPVEDGLASGPADLLEQLRDRFRQHDVGAEVRHVPGNRPPTGRSRVHRDHDLGRAHAAAARRDVSVADPPGRGVLEDLHTGVDDRVTQRRDEPRRLYGRAVGEVDALPKHR